MSRYPNKPLELKSAWMRERMGAKAAAEADGQLGVIANYLTIRDVASQLKISYSKARVLIKDEPGVLNLSQGKRKLRRIPREVF